MNMRERIAAGKLFIDDCEELRQDKLMAKKLMRAYNLLLEPGDDKEQERLIKEICRKAEKAVVEPPFYFSYGYNIYLGEGAFIGMNCKLLDDTAIRIGKDALISPGVTIVTAGVPTDPWRRDFRYAAPVHIGDGCWIGANVTICPGVTIGAGTVIGAGSVVSESVGGGVLAVGNPCKAVRRFCHLDERYYFDELEFEPEDLEELGRLT